LWPEDLLVDRAQLLILAAPRMTVLGGRLRVLGDHAGKSAHGVFTGRTAALTNDFFVNLLEMSRWARRGSRPGRRGRDRKTKELKWTATRVDLIFDSHLQLRARSRSLCVRGLGFVRDSVAAWAKVTNLGRFDLTLSHQSNFP
jgi:catalase-peroxidase